MSKNKFSVKITDSMFFEDLLWMSYRYCIGRKTIAAHSHAGSIAKNAYNALSDERKEFMAHDIRREINDVVNHLDNAYVHDYRHHITQDGLSTIFYRLLEKYGWTPPEWVFTNIIFNIDDDVIKLDEYHPSDDRYVSETLLSLYYDLLPWIKLANCFDKHSHKTLVTEYEGEVKEYECFSYPYLSKTEDGRTFIDKKWCSVERYLANPTVDSYIDMGFVKDIK